MKKCSPCGLEKTLDCFYKDKTRKDGHAYKCIDCSKAYCEANKEELLAKSRAYYQANKEEIIGKKRAYYAANKEKIAAYDRSRAKANPERIREKGRRRRAMKLEVNENYTKEDEAFTKNLFDHACFNCGSTENLTVDHYRPLSKGNALTLTNAIILCISCNSSKNNKDPEQFFSEEQITIIQEVFDMVEEQV